MCQWIWCVLSVDRSSIHHTVIRGEYIAQLSAVLVRIGGQSAGRNAHYCDWQLSRQLTQLWYSIGTVGGVSSAMSGHHAAREAHVQAMRQSWITSCPCQKAEIIAILTHSAYVDHAMQLSLTSQWASYLCYRA